MHKTKAITGLKTSLIRFQFRHLPKQCQGGKMLDRAGTRRIGRQGRMVPQRFVQILRLGPRYRLLRRLTDVLFKDFRDLIN